MVGALGAMRYIGNYLNDSFEKFQSENAISPEQL